MATSLNVRIQGHAMLLVEVEGSHTLQNTYSSFDLHLGQSCSFLVTADQPPMDYYIVVSSRFTSTVLSTTAVLHYSNSGGQPVGPPPGGPTIQIDWSLNQARSIRYPRPHSAETVRHFTDRSLSMNQQMESDSEWPETESARLISLWSREHHKNHQARKLCSCHQWQAKIRCQQRLLHPS